MPNTFRKYKDMEKARTTRNQQRKRNYARSRRGAFRRDQGWTASDMVMLETFLGTDRQLSTILGRSVEAIQIKRSRSKK